MTAANELLKDRVYEDLKRMVLSGQLRPGEKVAERDLTKKLNVSRTPLREALSQLVREGLIVSVPQRGHFVRSIDAKAVADLYDLREVLETYAIRLAAPQISEEEIAELDSIKAQLARFESDPAQGEDELRIGQRVHEILARAARNELLYDMLARLYDRLEMLIWIDALYADEAKITRAEHLALIEAARRRDEKTLTEIAVTHLRRSKENVLRVLRARPHGLL